MRVQKRNHMIVDYKEETIANAIRKAMSETLSGVDETLSKELAYKVTRTLEEEGLEIVTVDEIQNIVEDLLMQYRRDAAKEYIIYRYERDKERKKNPSSGPARKKSKQASQSCGTNSSPNINIFLIRWVHWAASSITGLIPGGFPRT
jgi:Oxygen-sensitive ribonucleoside-triphosphate reductase